MAQRLSKRKVATKPIEKPSVPQERTAAEHQRQFNQLLDDAIFGVPPPKKRKKK